jgi:hypothetical protein
MNGKSYAPYQLWVDSLAGSDEALQKMQDYNVNDVIVLEEVYLRLRPWIKSHANIALYGEGEKTICPNCGGEEVEPDGNFYYTPAGRYATYRCKCGAVSRSRSSDLGKDERKNLIISVAR